MSGLLNDTELETAIFEIFGQLKSLGILFG
jgi:hypothetical protein